MKRLIGVLLLLAVCSVVMAEDVVFSTFPSMGPKTCAVPTFTVYLATFTALPTLPDGTRRFTIGNKSAVSDLIAGARTNIATGTVGCGIRIPALTSRAFDIATTTPPLYFLASGSADASATIDLAE